MAESRKRARPRTVRRALDRSQEKLADAREKLTRVEPGGSPARPVEVHSASVIEGQARSLGCARGCEGEARIVDHAAQTLEGVRLRAVRTSCQRCGAERTLYFRLLPDAPN